MSKISPTTVLPYTKTSIEPDTTFNAKNTSNALSTKKQSKNQTIKHLFGAINAPAAYSAYIDQETSGHIGTVLSSWRKRKQ